MRGFAVAFLTSLVLIVAAPCVFAYEHDAYVTYGNVKATSATVTNDKDEIVTSLNSGDKIKASVYAAPGNSSIGSEDVSLIIATYSDGKLYDITCENQTISSKSKIETDYLTVPASGNPGVRVYIWGNIELAQPLAAIGDVNRGTEVQQIIVGNEAVKDFSPDVYEYDITVNAGYTDWPDIIVLTDNFVSDITIERNGNFPLSQNYTQYIKADVAASGTSGTAVAEITVGDKVYKLNITQDVPQITGIELKYWDSADSDLSDYNIYDNSSLRVGYNIRQIEWPYSDVNLNTEAGDENGEFVGVASKYYSPMVNTYTNFSPVFSNRTTNWIQFDYAPELVGANQICFPLSENAVLADEQEYIKFKIDRSARIYYSLGNSAASMDDTWSIYTNSIYENNSDNRSNCTYYAPVRYAATSSTNVRLQPHLSRFYYKDFHVEPGETLEITLPSVTTNSHILYIKYQDSDLVENASYTSDSVSQPVSTVFFDSPLTRISNTLVKFDIFRPLTADSPLGLGTGNVMYASSVFSDKQSGDNAWFPTYLTNDVKGGTALVLPSDVSGVDSISFDITASADVYILTNYEQSEVGTAFDGWTALGGSNDVAARVRTADLSYFTMYKNTCYRRSFDLEEGERRTVTISLPGVSSSRSIMVVIKQKGSACEENPEEWNVLIEAEDVDSAVQMREVSNSDASNGSYMISTASASQTSPSRDIVNLEYSVDVPQNDAYFVWARVRISSGNAYLYANFDDGLIKPYKKVSDSVNNNGEWHWSFVDKYYLYEGEHTFNVRYMTKSLQFDCFYITTDYSFTPEGAQPSVDTDIYRRDANGNITSELYYNLPSYLPPDEHPRLLFRASDIDRIKSNLTNEQNLSTYNKLLTQAEYNTDGKLPEIQYGDASNQNYNIGLAIEANAFLYQMNNDPEYGYKAINLAKNYIESIMVDQTNASSTGRIGMYVVWTVAICYDWCYDLLTEEDKEFLQYYMLLQSSYSEPGFPPLKYGLNTGNSEVNGHIPEFQLLCGQFAASIALYDELPDFYNVAAGRILQYTVPAVNIFNKYSMYSEGSSYGMYRHYFEVINNYLFKAMGYDDVYDETGLSTLGYFYLRQPDGKKMSYGDDYNYYKTGYVTAEPYIYFYLGNMLKDPYLKSEYYRSVTTYDSNTVSLTGSLTPAVYLIVNDVNVPCDKSFRDFPLTMFSGEDSGYMVARTSWDEGIDSNTVVALLNLKTHYLMGHDHKDIGHFSLYYKGFLALDSGIYEGAPFTDSNGNYITDVGYGNIHHRSYAKQSIAHNTVLVLDPNETLSESDASRVSTVDGGQKMSVTQAYAATADDLWNDDNTFCEILGYNWGPDLQTPEYSYIRGDLTDAYTDKVEEFQRTFVFFNFNDETYPAALIVFDRVRSSNADFTKKWLLHSEEEPDINGNTTTIKRTEGGYNGRLINQTLMPDNGFTISKVGGEGYEFYVEGSNGVSRNYEMEPKSENAEVGNWRIEISPTTAEKQSYFMNVIQLSDNDDSIEPLQARIVQNGTAYIGVEINNHVAYVRKDNHIMNSSFSIEPEGSGGERFFVITGLAKGQWSVRDENYNLIATACVYDDINDSISFVGTGTKFHLAYTADDTLEPLDYSIYGLKNNTQKSIDIAIDGVYVTFDNDAKDVNGVAYVPIEETLNKLGINYTTTDSSVTVGSTSINYSSAYVRDYDGVKYTTISNIRTLVGGTSVLAVSYDSNAYIVRLKHR